MATMDIDRMVEIQDRLFAATESPWEAVEFGAGEPISIQADLEPGHPVPLARVMDGGYRSEAAAITGRRIGTAAADAAFIVHARQDVGQLLAEWMANQALLSATDERLAIVREELASAEDRRRGDLTLAAFAAKIFAGLTMIGGICIGFAFA